jgi:hypothetical protein
MRDEALAIRREIGLKWRDYWRDHTADALARAKTIDCGIVRHFLIETRSLPTLARSYPRSFAFYVASPGRSILPSSF